MKIEALPTVKLREDRPLDRVLFATDGRGVVAVLDSVGVVVDFLADAPDEFREEVQDFPFPGIWIWEGRVRARHYNTPDMYEWDVWFEGAVRPLNDDEHCYLRKNDDPWDRTLWEELT